MFNLTYTIVKGHLLCKQKLSSDSLKLNRVFGFSVVKLCRDHIEPHIKEEKEISFHRQCSLLFN